MLVLGFSVNRAVHSLSPGVRRVGAALPSLLVSDTSCLLGPCPMLSRPLGSSVELGQHLLVLGVGPTACPASVPGDGAVPS